MKIYYYINYRLFNRVVNSEVSATYVNSIQITQYLVVVNLVYSVLIEIYL